MQIKEVELRVGMRRANIRYYEKEGLLNSTNRDENNYREYTEEDVEQLLRIKVLRILEVPMEDIRVHRNNKLKLNQIIKERMRNLQILVDKVISDTSNKENSIIL